MKIKSQSGFTLIELIVVIVIIGILAAVAVPKFLDLSTSAQIAACDSNCAALTSACNIYYADAAVSGAAAYPADGAALVAGGFIDTVPVCPVDNTSAYAGYATGIVTCSSGAH